ncbi:MULTISPECIES: tyrosine-protein phosphatase [Streptomyces]|uniref:Tyrosine-protein phosphatase n=1 Tax=Streptomyces morookaense TaxID=1970 RepID=A0A7Y7BAE7_STRMO|nr:MULTISPECIES: tyrosine-protein phosphatase [Streptomyces]MCC2280467.1 tyrosine-protein phosphatase [Streptomyces sp. ET3-23]NVK81521.1 tyrosine-protein phosphatase [Streptomyces morookaense]GHF24593.1 protein-tyrosine-phosphatase [Streptomyces morookaense]
MTQTPYVPHTEPVLAGVRNFRDLGGLPAADGRRIRPGVLFRSGHLARATAEDAEFLGSLGLHTVFDFRNAADIELEGADIALPGVRNVNLPLSDPADGGEFWRMVRESGLDRLREALSAGQAAGRMTASYREIVTTRTAEHSRVLHTLAQDAVPALMHCSAGKDRAGLSVMATLLALGVPADAVEADYLESNAPHRRYTVKRRQDVDPATEAEVAQLLSPLFEARAEYLAAAFTAIEDTWGTTERYLSEGLGLAPATRELLQKRLLTD